MKKQLRSNLQQVKQTRDEEIELHSLSDDDAPIIDAWPADVEIILPKTKVPLSIRIDEDVLEFFKNQGPGYQTRINSVLKSYMGMHLSAGYMRRGQQAG